MEISRIQCKIKKNMATLDSRKIVKITYLPMRACDKISEELRAEICRFLVAEVDDSTGHGGAIFSPTEPPKDFLWVTTDQTTKLPLGTVKKWNLGTDTWEQVGALTTTQVVPITPGVQFGSVIASGNGTFSVSWSALYSSDNYVLSAYASGDPAGASFHISSKSSTGAAITVTGWTANFNIELNASGVSA
jgi:hypothetical protein